jgi:UTP--glucose-1-phosphate uridylyltransferase
VKVNKAVVTAASRQQRHLPLQSLVDRDGRPKSALVIILDEIARANIDQIAIVVAPGDQEAYAAAAGPHARNLTFIEQAEPRGYAHAVAQAHAFTGDSPFLLLVGDHLYVSRSEKGCAQQLVEFASTENCAVSAVQATHESKLPYYGAVGGRRAGSHSNAYEIREILEKPTPTQAEQQLIVPGLRNGHYLCFFGMHVLPPGFMQLLKEMVESDGGSMRAVSPALAKLAQRERYLALEVEGRRYDIGLRYGLLTAQLALALEGRDRAEVLSTLLEVVAARTHDSASPQEEA